MCVIISLQNIFLGWKSNSDCTCIYNCIKFFKSNELFPPFLQGKMAELFFNKGLLNYYQTYLIQGYFYVSREIT